VIDGGVEGICGLRADVETFSISIAGACECDSQAHESYYSRRVGCKHERKEVDRSGNRADVFPV
jgi:hypothetical protein